MLIYFVKDGEIVNTDNCIAIEFKEPVNTSAYRINFKSEQHTYWYGFGNENTFNEAKNKIINALKKHLKYLELDVSYGTPATFNPITNVSDYNLCKI